MTESAGRLVGSQYRIGGLIGRGGMGEVWRGVDASGAPVAVKVLLPRFAEDPEVVQRFVAERRLLTGVSDRHVVRVRDMVVEGSTLAIVMDLVEGGDLRGLLRERGTLSAAEACRVGSQVALGLAAIHARRIVHRDVKPENVLLDRSVDPPLALLTDFGVSKLVGDDPGASGVTALAGTPLYLAPELIGGGRPGPWSDLYSLGVMLYELVCGVTPFTGLVPAAVLHAQVSLLPGRPAGFDDRLWNLVWQLLGKDPGRRPGDAGVVAGQLAGLAGLLEGQGRLVKLSAPPAPVAVDPGLSTWVGGVGGFAATQVLAPQQPTPVWAASNGLTGPGGYPAAYGPTPAPGYQGQPSFRGALTSLPMGYGVVTPGPMPANITPAVFGPSYPPAQFTPVSNSPQAALFAKIAVAIAAVAAIVLALIAVLLFRDSYAEPALNVEPVTTTIAGTEPTATAGPAAPRTSAPPRTTTSARPTGAGVTSLSRGTWITVLESLPKDQSSLTQAQVRADTLSAHGFLVVVVNSDTIPGLNPGYWALSVTGFASRDAAVAACPALGREAGGTCYPREIG